MTRHAAAGQKRVVVAMSGGVDSSVAAMLLVDAGFEVIGVMLRLWSEPSDCGLPNRCCTPQSVDDARRVAAMLDIPFYLIGYEQEFERAVVDDFVEQYARGRTPNPCLVCNREIRFTLLLQRAASLGAQFLATGHYARIVSRHGRYHLLKGADANKDQSYVLSVLSQQQLAHLMFPIGELTKPAVRALARERDLPVAEKAESQDACFLPGKDYRPFVAARAASGVQPGPIYDAEGRVLGAHRGLVYYTVGQRHGLGLATGAPLYVTHMDALRNSITVGPPEGLLRNELTVSNVNYVGGATPAAPFTCGVRLRYKAREWPARVAPIEGNRGAIVFEQPQRPVSPGQTAVFYDGDEVLGCGVID